MLNYWSDKNDIDPFSISPRSSTEIWIKCQENPCHKDYKITCNNFFCGKRCSYCAKKRVDRNDSFGAKYPNLLSYWDDSNAKSPYEVLPKSNKPYIFNCKVHGKFKSTVCDFVESVYHCPKCALESSTSSLETKVKNYLDSKKIKYLNEYDCFLKPINPKTNRVMPFDNELIDYKIIIEVHGKQHYNYNNNWYGKNKEEKIQKYEYSKWKDEYKKQYALNRNYTYVAIPYWEFKNESYKKTIDEIIKNNTPTTTERENSTYVEM